MLEISIVPQLVDKHVKLVDVCESVGAAMPPVSELSTYEEYEILWYVD